MSGIDGTLDELGLKYGTDKASSFHSYLGIYESYLAPMRERVKTLIEAGVAQGASMRMWAEYFPQAAIVGIDHEEKYIHGAEMPANVKLLLADATNGQLWARLGAEYGLVDIIVDDGGHYSEQIAKTFEYAWPLLNCGGIYIVEDLHHVFAQELPAKAGRTAFEFFYDKVMQMQEGGANQCGKPTTSQIAFVHFYKSLVILGKR